MSFIVARILSDSEMFPVLIWSRTNLLTSLAASQQPWRYAIVEAPSSAAVGMGSCWVIAKTAAASTIPLPDIRGDGHAGLILNSIASVFCIEPALLLVLNEDEWCVL